MAVLKDLLVYGDVAVYGKLNAPIATVTEPGLMSAADKNKFEAITGQTSTTPFTAEEQARIQSAIGIYPWQEATF